MATQFNDKITMTKSELKDIIREAIDEDRGSRSYPKEVKVIHEQSWSQRMWDMVTKE
ncbi:MAG: hypothetical protein Q8L27_00845 [archaeon]|nr:hypothetical protein [archaeon]